MMISGIAYSIGFIGSLGLVAWVLLTTNPSTLHPLGILGFFIALYGVVFCCLGIVQTMFRYGVSRFRIKDADDPELQLARTVTVRRSHTMVLAVLAFAPVVLLAMNTVGATSIVEVALVIVFEAVACFYILRKM